MTDFRALCTELLSAMDTLYKQSVTTPHSQTIEIDGIQHAIPIGNDILAQDVVYADLMARARAALDQPEPEGPTDQQLKVYSCEWWHKFGFVKDKATCTWLIDEIDPEHFVDFLRDALAYWNTSLTKEFDV